MVHKHSIYVFNHLTVEYIVAFTFETRNESKVAHISVNDVIIIKEPQTKACLQGAKQVLENYLNQRICREAK